MYKFYFWDSSENYGEENMETVIIKMDIAEDDLEKII